MIQQETGFGIWNWFEIRKKRENGIFGYWWVMCSHRYVWEYNESNDLLSWSLMIHLKQHKIENTAKKVGRMG